MAEKFRIESPNVRYLKDVIEADYSYDTTQVYDDNGVTKVKTEMSWKTVSPIYYMEGASGGIRAR